MTAKISKNGAKTIKTLILLVVGTMLAAQILSQSVLVFIYPALMLGLVFLLPVFHEYSKTPDFSFFGNLCFAAILYLAFLLLLPVVYVAGYMGMAIISFVFVVVAMSSEKVMGSDIDATLMTIIFSVLQTISMNNTSFMLPAFLTAAILLDLSRKFPTWVRGLTAGLAFSSILLGFSGYTPAEISTGVVFSTVAGLVAGSIFGLFHLDDEKHIEMLFQKW